MRTISIFIPDLRGGGAEKSMLRLAEQLSQRNYHLNLLVKTAAGVLKDQLPPSIRLLPFNVSRMSATLIGLARHLRREKPDVLISALELPNLLSITARSLARVRTPVIITIRSIVSQIHRFTFSKNLDFWLQKSLYPHADEIVCVSKGAADDLSSFLSIPRPRIKAIYNPIISEKLYAQSRQPLDHPWFEPGEPPVILGVGRLEAVKDFQTLLQAFSLLRKSSPARLMILGEGSLRHQLEEQARALGIAEDTAMPGFAENPYAHMRRASALALPSIYEGLPGVLIEAMACGCPVVSTDCPHGPSEILDGGKYGHLVPVGDAERMAQALQAVLEGDRRPAPPEWLEQFSEAKVTQQYIDLIEGVCER